MINNSEKPYKHACPLGLDRLRKILPSLSLAVILNEIHK